MQGESSEAGAALTSLLLSGSSQKVGNNLGQAKRTKKNFHLSIFNSQFKYLPLAQIKEKNMKTANYPTSESILAAKLLAAKGIDSMGGG